MYFGHVRTQSGVSHEIKEYRLSHIWDNYGVEICGLIWFCAISVRLIYVPEECYE